MQQKDVIRIFKCFIVAVVFLLSGGCTQKNNTNESHSQTDQLIIYAAPYDDEILKAAVNIFKREYPDVDVEYKEFEKSVEGNNTYLETLQYDLSTGNGPDIIFSSYYNMDDIYSMMKSGIFMDLNTLFDNDETFDKKAYNEAVFNSGIYKNKLHYIPITYSVLTLITTEEALNYAGMSIDNEMNYEQLSEQFMKFMLKYKGGSDELLFTGSYLDIEVFSPWNGIEAVDYENEKILTETEEFKKSMEMYKAYYKLDKHADENEQVVKTSATGDYAIMVRNNKALFARCNYSSKVLETCSMLSEDQKPVIRCFPTYDDKVAARPENIAAIRNGTPNQVNAYNFLRIMLSEEFQMKYGMCSCKDGVVMDIPILSAAIKEGLNYSNDMYSYFSEDQSADIIQMLTDLFSNVDICLMPNNKVNKLIWNEMKPYFKNERSSEECMQRLNNKLELYIYE
ncbi:MAG: ABC transporter substrate-binding protein [Clostridium sp.]|nr:ABC transporter substrate-binding protein [Clostridium sp.]MCM1546929.1 ABC transporter substrate-binding protein [Ruminococcus sp.]